MHKISSPSTMDIPTNSDNSSMVELYSLVGGINLIKRNNNDNEMWQSEKYTQLWTSATFYC